MSWVAAAAAAAATVGMPGVGGAGAAPIPLTDVFGISPVSRKKKISIYF